ncbi:MAG: glycosyltransferase [Oscillospiraceae bacterium]|nr:glycosyltransferase [Oscillospiraceae bacterium]
MNILFVTDRVSSTGDPNINLAQNISKVLQNEHNVFFMGHDTDKAKQNDFCFYYPWDEKVRKVFFSLNGKSTFGKLATLLSHPFLSFLGVFKVFNIDLIDRLYKKQIEFVCKKYDIDAAISLSAPFYTAKGLAKSDISAKKIVMMFDPYAKHYIYQNARTEKQEKSVFDTAHHIFVPQLIAGEYNRDNLSAFEFPCLLADNTDKKTDNSTQLLPIGKTNIVYCGSLYADIRSPEYLYELVKKSGNPNLHITIVGGVYGSFSDEFNAKYTDFIKQHVTLIGKVSKEKAREYLNAADIVVNIGNTINNMLPSKVLECISTGKRVLNLCQIENCPSLPYFEKYGNNLDLYTKKEIDSDTLCRFADFVNTEKHIPQEDILQKFAAATPHYVAQQIIDAINS